MVTRRSLPQLLRRKHRRIRNMDFIWSPWRYPYVADSKQPFCVFCIGDDASQDEKRLILHRATHNFIILNLFPYTCGHLMVAPYTHLAALTQASSDQTSELMELGKRAVSALERVYRPDGFNIGMNLGHCAGAGVKDHFHLHVVPRWAGDSNFMTITGETRVLPEELSITFRRLKQAL
jgi:ATP adenylyltransferase